MPRSREDYERAMRESVRRQEGPSDAVLERMRASNEEANDWSGTCRVCGVVLTGTLAELRAHQHAEAQP